IGDVRTLDFTGARTDDLAASFRFSQVSDAGAVPVKLASGDAYRLATRLTPPPPTDKLATARVVKMEFAAPELTKSIKDAADAHTKGVEQPYDQAKKLESWLQSGYYSDGGLGSKIAPGHNLRRLDNLLTASQLVGNGEQYAAAMAVMAEHLNLPARV